MSASATPPASLTHFSAPELDMLAKTADALSAYLGKPVLAEVVLGDEGTEWVTYGVPMDEKAEADEEQTHVQMGGPGARLLGNRGGLPQSDDDTYDCLYLWAIQISLNDGERFIKLDHDGEESAWSDNLEEVLPFALTEEPQPDPDEEDEEEHDDADDEDDDTPYDDVHNHRH
ncbi:MAG: hypothetical protein K0S02_3215 [Achromobacter mucicolens]|uniref:hypothetical protein n=1 Tax=Achromobacter mucicolens TaxID=1389922 RepID=UPI00242CEC32|nr:hypothetical protein [Achromobacter mucicolens]MDF2862943.1 hypothetical protein [Achromobacter mucicolens]